MLVAHSGAQKLQRQDLLALPTPDRTETHRPVPHAALVEGILTAIRYRNIDVVSEEYAASPDGARLFGVLTLSLKHNDVALTIGLRNSHDKSFSLGLVGGFRVFVCDNLSFQGDFLAVAKKHSKNLDIVDTIAIGVDRIQRRFQPMVERVDVWKEHMLPDIRAKEIIYDAFTGALDAPKHLLKAVHHHYFEPEYDEFKPRTLWSVQNAFTSAFKTLDPIPMYKSTSSLGEYFEALS